MSLVEVVHDRPTVPLKPKTEARLTDMAVEDLHCTANSGSSGVMVKSGVKGTTTESGRGALVDS